MSCQASAPQTGQSLRPSMMSRWARWAGVISAAVAIAVFASAVLASRLASTSDQPGVPESIGDIALEAVLLACAGQVSPHRRCGLAGFRTGDKVVATRFYVKGWASTWRGQGVIRAATSIARADRMERPPVPAQDRAAAFDAARTAP